MRTEQKIFNDLIETIVNNSENNEAKITNVELWAKSWKEEMKQALTLTDVSQQRELLKGFMQYVNCADTTSHIYGYLLEDYLKTL
jgi:predicted secreted acid phosphatase